MFYFLTILAFAVDRLSKWWIASYLAQHGPLEVHDWLVLRLTYNRGMVFGLWQGSGSWMGWISVLVVLGLLYYLRQLPKEARIMRAGLALVLGGALGNLVDRVLVGEVLDFITSPLVPWVFNFADVFINGGMVIFAAGSLFYRPDDHDVEEASPGNADNAVASGDEPLLLDENEDEDGDEEEQKHQQWYEV